MANEITITTGLRLSNGNLVVDVATTTLNFDQVTARGGSPGTQDIGTSEETISFGDVVPGWVWMRNLDPTNFVTWGNVTLNLDQKLSPGGTTLIEMVSGGVLIMQADTSACKVQIVALNI